MKYAFIASVLVCIFSNLYWYGIMQEQQAPLYNQITTLQYELEQTREYASHQWAEATACNNTLHSLAGR